MLRLEPGVVERFVLGEGSIVGGVGICRCRRICLIASISRVVAVSNMFRTFSYVYMHNDSD